MLYVEVSVVAGLWLVEFELLRLWIRRDTPYQTQWHCSLWEDSGTIAVDFFTLKTLYVDVSEVAGLWLADLVRGSHRGTQSCSEPLSSAPVSSSTKPQWEDIGWRPMPGLPHIVSAAQSESAENGFNIHRETSDHRIVFYITLYYGKITSNVSNLDTL